MAIPITTDEQVLPTCRNNCILPVSQPVVGKDKVDDDRAIKEIDIFRLEGSRKNLPHHY